MRTDPLVRFPMSNFGFPEKHQKHCHLLGRVGYLLAYNRKFKANNQSTTMTLVITYSLLIIATLVSHLATDIENL